MKGVYLNFMVVIIFGNRVRDILILKLKEVLKLIIVLDFKLYQRFQNNKIIKIIKEVIVVKGDIIKCKYKL